MNWKITDESLSILMFDEVPILFEGQNNKKQKIIASLYKHNVNKDEFQYLYLVLRNRTHSKYINRVISHRTMIKSAISCFLVTKNYKMEVLRYKLKNHSNLNPNNLPLPNTYFLDSKIKTK